MLSEIKKQVKKIYSIVGLWLIVLMLNSFVVAQTKPNYMDSTPGKTDFLSAQQKQAMLLGGEPQPMTVPNSLPFPVSKNYPSFYVIPPNKRPKILHQGNCGSCVAWSTMTALASVVANQPNMLISPQTIGEAPSLFAFAGRNCNKDAPNSGWWNSGATEYMANRGVFLANIEDGKSNINSTKLTTVPDSWIKVGKYGAIGSLTQLPAGVNKFDAMRTFLSTYGGMTADFAVLTDFNLYKSGVYNHKKFVDSIIATFEPSSQLNSETQKALRTVKQNMQIAFDKTDGGHAVTVIGYFSGGKITNGQLLSIFAKPDDLAFLDTAFTKMEFDSPAFWIVQNSWGTDFGISGIFLYEAGQDMSACNWGNKEACKLDDEMYFMLDPIITFNGAQVGAKTDEKAYLSGIWEMYDNKNVKYEKTALIQQNGTTLNVNNGYGSASTVTLNGANFSMSGLTATVTGDGNRISWSNGFVWIKQITSANSLTGFWVMYNDKNVKYDKFAEISQNGTTLIVNNGYGTVANANVTGSTFTLSGLTANVAPVGNTIIFSNGFTWKLFNLSGSWTMFDNKNVQLSKPAQITHSGSFLNINNGFGTVENANIKGVNFTAFGLTATASQDGKKISWSNGFVWTKP